MNVLEAAFARADPEHFAWQTRHEVVAREEAALVARAFLPLGERVLDVGCAEGATLRHLGAPGAVGVDLFEEKVAFARRAVDGARFERASVYELPFDEGAFDHVIVRDVVHHLEEPAKAFAEIHRVLSSGGRVDVLEPCRYNPLILAHALAIPAERGELRSTEGFLRSLAGGRFEIERVERLQALPIHRVVFHPRLGRPSLARSRGVVRAVAGLERLAERVLPRAMWAYIHLRMARA